VSANSTTRAGVPVGDVPAQRSLPAMAPRTRSRILRLAIALLVLWVIRELSIRRHEADLHDWPTVAPDH
jgi:di/tricarboxylate transporter